MTLTVKKCVAAAAVMLALVSCSDFDNDWDAKHLNYIHSFENEFGNIDANHTWNTASQGTITVDIPSGKNFTVKMYTSNPRYSAVKSYLIGEFNNIEGGKTQSFVVDMPSNLEYVYVGLIDENGDRIILPAKINAGKASVSFPKVSATNAKTRAVFTPSDEKEGYADPYISWEAADKWVFGYDEILPVLRTLPEGKGNIGKVTQNLCYVSMGEFTIYPMHYVSNNSGLYGGGDVLGVYYYDNLGNIHNVDIWQRSNDWHQVFIKDANGVENFEGQSGYWSCQYPQETTSYYNLVDGVPTGLKTDYLAIRSEGIKVDIPKGTKFGFYIGTNDNGGTRLYSEASLNKEQQSYDGLQCYAASFHDDGELFLCFEDWHYKSSGSDRDFNDIVLGFHGSEATPVIIDKDEDTEAMTYIVACEDLGGTDDFDFNDVVFGISHVSGQDEAYIQLRAAGGILPAKIQYDGADITFGSSDKTEVHDVFGVETSTMVNTGIYHADFKKSNVFAVDANAFTIVDDAQKFTIAVTYSDGTRSALSIPNSGNKTKAPQAFLVANPEWIWPSERVNIKTAEPQFMDWVQNHLSTSWCDAVWGVVNEIRSVPNGATDLLSQSTGNIEYTTSDNFATVTIPASCFTENESYQLVIKPTSACDVSFTLGGGNMSIMPNGTVHADKVTKFTFNATATNAVIANTGNVVVTFTFANGVNAAEKMALLYWTGETGGGNSPAPAGNDYSEYGTSLSSVLDLNNPNITYKALVPVSSLPQEGEVHITYIYDMTDQSYVNIQNPTLTAWWYNDTNQYSQYWDNVIVAEPATATKSDLINGNPKYVTVSFTINASSYQGKTYLGLGTTYSNGAVVDVRYK